MPLVSFLLFYILINCHSFKLVCWQFIKICTYELNSVLKTNEWDKKIQYFVLVVFFWHLCKYITYILTIYIWMYINMYIPCFDWRNVKINDYTLTILCYKMAHRWILECMIYRCGVYLRSILSNRRTVKIPIGYKSAHADINFHQRLLYHRNRNRWSL